MAQKQPIQQPVVQQKQQYMIVQQPVTVAPATNVVVVNQAPAKPRGLLGSLENAFNQAGKELDKAIDGATHLSITDRLRHGNIVQLQSKLNNKSLRILETGLVDCKGEGGTACHFRVVPGSSGPNSIKLLNIAQPTKYIAIIKEYLVGYGQGGTDCDLLPYLTIDGQHVMLESAIQSGAHVGALVSGDITSPPQTSKATDASHFRVLYVSQK